MVYFVLQMTLDMYLKNEVTMGNEVTFSVSF